jgi:two-component system sensor histidine kinase KdpD
MQSLGRSWPPLPETRRVLSILAAGLAVLIAVTLVAGILESRFGVADASSVYLLAVVVMASRFGLWPAVATSLVSVVLYDLLFTEPRLAFAVADPQEWLSLLLFLIVAVVTGRLAGLQTERARDASRRAGEAQSLFAISRSLVTARSVQEAGLDIVALLEEGAAMDGIWITIGSSPSQERQVASRPTGGPRPEPMVHWLLHRGSPQRADEWVRTHTGPPRAGRSGASPSDEAPADIFRVVIEADGRPLGSVWARRPHRRGIPGPTETRLLALAADQIGLAMRREELASEATKAEVARRSDTLKSALLDSVSHGLRTPLATIRAVAGGLLDEETATSPEATRRAAAAIDAEAARLSEVVRNVLDLSRIEGNALRADLEVHELGELMRASIRRQRDALPASRLELDLPDDLPPVLVDAVFFDQALANVLENAASYAGAETRVRLRASIASDEAFVDLVVEDAGPGVPDQDLEMLFQKFFRRDGTRPARAGLGIGLSVARGLVEAMGGELLAEHSQLGGLALRFRLPRSDHRSPLAIAPLAEHAASRAASRP